MFDSNVLSEIRGSLVGPTNRITSYNVCYTKLLRDAIGAKWYGYVSFWVNRSGAPLDRLGARPDASGSSLDDAVTFLLQQRKH